MPLDINNNTQDLFPITEILVIASETLFSTHV